MPASSTGEPAAPVTGPDDQPERLITIPNLISALRLLGVPLFLWLVLGPHADGWALVVLAVAGITDYLDGKVARALNQTSRIGALLDPAADRLYIVATILAFVLRDIVPLWFALALIGREVVVGGCLLVLRRAGYGPLAVHYLGKAATFALLYAFPLLLLAAGHGTPSDVARPIAWAFTVWGGALYALAGALYVAQTVGLVRSTADSS